MQEKPLQDQNTLTTVNKIFLHTQMNNKAHLNKSLLELYQSGQNYLIITLVWTG